jgi:hypothetical protein
MYSSTGGQPFVIQSAIHQHGNFTNFLCTQPAIGDVVAEGCQSLLDAFRKGTIFRRITASRAAEEEVCSSCHSEPICKGLGPLRLYHHYASLAVSVYMLLPW